MRENSCRCIVGVSVYTARCLVLVYSPQGTVRITVRDRRRYSCQIKLVVNGIWTIGYRGKVCPIGKLGESWKLPIKTSIKAKESYEVSTASDNCLTKLGLTSTA